MSGGRTYWMGIDVAWMRRDLNVRLAMECGGEAFSVLLTLWLDAKQQRSTDGRVKFGVAPLAHYSFVPPAKVEEIITKAVEIGALTDLERDEHGRLKATLTDFAADDKRGGEALKKANQRAARDDGTEGDTPGQDPELSPTVPLEEKRGEEKDPPTGGSRTPPRKRVVDQDQLPDDLAPALAERVPALLAVLADVQSQRGGQVPTLRGVGLVVRAYPRRDHWAVVKELEFWALAGRGQRKPVKDWAATYRTFLGNAVDADPLRAVDAPAIRPLTDRERRTADRHARARAAGLGELMKPTDVIEGSAVDAAA